MRVTIFGRSNLLSCAAHLPHAASLEIDLFGAYRTDARYRIDEAAFEVFAGEVRAPFFCDARIDALAGELPRFRSKACPDWAILMGEPHAGLCIHRMEPGALDSDPVFLCEQLHRKHPVLTPT